MTGSMGKRRRLTTIVAVALGIVAVVAPSAQADPAVSAKYGSADPWQYNLGQGTGPAVPLMTEHAPGQNRADRYGPADPWLVNVLARPAAAGRFITDHSAGQNGDGGGRVAAPVAAPTSSPGFDWRDAAIGAAVALALVLLAAGATRAARRRHTLAHIGL